jgi:geranylgeranylglycerol-phosphate geranylgeranyltransferase
MVKSEKLNAWATIFRLGNNIGGVIGVFLGAIMALGEMPNGNLLLITSLQALSVFSFMSSWNALNDYLDFDIDKVGKPDRPLPSGIISISEAKIGILSMMLISLSSISGAAFFASHSNEGLYQWLPSAAIWIVALFLLMNYESSSTYSLNLKNRGLPGNIAISASVAMVVLLGSSGVYKITNARVISIAVIGFLYNLSREIIKDVQDMESDIGRNTLAKRLGAEKTRIIAYLISLMALISIISPFALGLFKESYLIFTVPSIFVLLMVKTKLANAQDFEAQQLLKKSLYLCAGAFLLCSLII